MSKAELSRKLGAPNHTQDKFQKGTKAGTSATNANVIANAVGIGGNEPRRV